MRCQTRINYFHDQMGFGGKDECGDQSRRYENKENSLLTEIV